MLTLAQYRPTPTLTLALGLALPLGLALHLAMTLILALASNGPHEIQQVDCSASPDPPSHYQALAVIVLNLTLALSPTQSLLGCMSTISVDKSCLNLLPSPIIPQYLALTAFSEVYHQY